MGIKQLVMGLTVAVLVCGCAENRTSFFIMGALKPETDCTAEANEDGPYLTQGVLDVSISHEYILYPLLSNQLSSMGDEDNLVAESNGIMVEGANVRIWRGGQCRGDTDYEFYQPAACYTPPQGLFSCGFVAVPSVYIGQMLESRPPDGVDYDIISIGVQMLGTTNGTRELETPEFCYTIRLVHGGTVICPPLDEANLRCGTTLPNTDNIGCAGQGELFDCCIFGETWCQTMCGF